VLLSFDFSLLVLCLFSVSCFQIVLLVSLLFTHHLCFVFWLIICLLAVYVPFVCLD
jgi:hypothetical protein